jgi:CHAT domain
MIRTGRRLPHIVVILQASLGEPKRALLFLFAEQSVMLRLSRKESLCTLSLPSLEPYSFVNSTVASSDEEAFRELVDLVPDGGALVVLAMTERQTIVFALDCKGNLETMEFGYWIWNNTGVMCYPLSLIHPGSEEDNPDWPLLETSLAAMSKSLWRDVVGPIWDLLDKELRLPSDAPVTFVTQGVMDYMPLHIAGREIEGCWRFAIEDRVIRFAPSLTALQLMKSKRRRHVRHEFKVAAFFDPVGDLPGSRTTELTAMIQKLGPGALKTWVGEDADRPALLDLLEKWDGSGFTDLHLSTHGMAVRDDPEESWIVLAKRGGRCGKNHGTRTVWDSGH